MTMAPAGGVKVMLCADDFGMSPGISRGILQLLERRRLTATSAITTRPAWRGAARELATFREVCDFGLHINLTYGRPLGTMERFAPAGVFPPNERVVRAALLGRLPLAEIRAEISRQFDAYEDAIQARPDFVDGHQHVHVLPWLRALVVEEVVRRYSGAGVWIRDSSDRPDRILARRLEAPQALGLSLIGRGARGLARRAAIGANEGVSGFWSFDPKRDYARDFRRFLVAPGSRHLIFCHPGFEDDDPAASDGVVTRRAEWEFLASPQLPETFEAAGARLALWREFDLDAAGAVRQASDQA